VSCATFVDSLLRRLITACGVAAQDGAIAHGLRHSYGTALALWGPATGHSATPRPLRPTSPQPPVQPWARRDARVPPQADGPEAGYPARCPGSQIW